MQNETTTFNYVASKTPEQDLLALAWEGQPEHLRQYKSGFEHIFDSLPRINEEDLDEDLFKTRELMKFFSEAVKQVNWRVQPEGTFSRTILALEKPMYLGTFGDKDHFQPGAEIVLAHWGEGFTSPVHGHASGYMHEDIISGKMRVNTYRLMPDGRVRNLETTIQEAGVFVSKYNPKTEERINLIHNFTAVEPSHSLHFLPEHTRDGKDNKFEVEEFRAIDSSEVTRLTSKEGMYLQPGDVALVRSLNVPEYGDHFLVVTGHPVVKPHGLRVQDKSVRASVQHTELINKYPLKTGLTLLKLNKEVAKEFLDFHGITVKGSNVEFPQE